MTHKQPLFVWKCPNNPDHVFRKSAWNMVKHTGYPCPYCPSTREPITKSGISQTSVSNSLRAVGEGLLFRRIHPTQPSPGLSVYHYNDLRANDPRYIAWKCENGPDHVSYLEVREVVRTGGLGCESCCPPQRTQICVGNSIATSSSNNATQYHPNGNKVPPRMVRENDNTALAVWKCPRGPDHVWPQEPNVRLMSTEALSCPFCDNAVGESAEVSVQNSVELAESLRNCCTNFIRYSL